MLELSTYIREEELSELNLKLNRKERVTVDMIIDGLKFIQQFEVDEELQMDICSMVYQYLKRQNTIPHNLYKFYIGAYYILSRHPLAFPNHQPKSEFCEQFGIKASALDYTVEKLVDTLDYIKILDDMNYPYFIHPKSDLIHSMTKTIVKDEVKTAHMRYLTQQRPINIQILCEDIVTSLVFEKKLFPEELFRQFFEIVQELVLKELDSQDFYKYLSLQQHYLI